MQLTCYTHIAPIFHFFGAMCNCQPMHNTELVLHSYLKTVIKYEHYREQINPLAMKVEHEFLILKKIMLIMHTYVQNTKFLYLLCTE